MSLNNLFHQKINYNLWKKFRYPLGIFFSYPLIGPYEVHLDVVHRCNLNCVMCWIYSPYRKKKINKNWINQKLDFTTFKNIIDSLKKNGTSKISIIGEGEPFLHDNIIDILTYIKKSEMKCSVITNGTLLNKEKIQELVDIGVDHIHISINAGTALSFCKIHHLSSKKMYEQLKENIIEFSNYENKPIITLSHVIFKSNYLEIEKMVDFGIKCKADRVYFKNLNVFSGIEKFALTDEQKTELIESIRKIDKFKLKSIKNNLNEFLQLSSNPLESVEEVPCYMGYVFSRIVNGKYVVPCCNCYRSPIGEISEDNSFEKIWKSKKYTSFRKMIFNKKDRENFGCDCYECQHFTENKKLDNLFNLIKIIRRH